jgi:hypothetical protein
VQDSALVSPERIEEKRDEPVARRPRLWDPTDKEDSAEPSRQPDITARPVTGERAESAW